MTGTIWDNISLRYHRQNENEIRSVINCFYKGIRENNYAKCQSQLITVHHSLCNHVPLSEVSIFMDSFFHIAINEQKWDDVIQLWLPDQNAQMVLPGYYKMVHRPFSIVCLRCMSIDEYSSKMSYYRKDSLGN
jgi:hypothetical protein